MASVLDNITALETMREANEDVLELIGNLKEVLTGINPVTFNMGDYSITVDSISKLIDGYRNGRFESIVLGNQTTGGKQVILSVTPEGVLNITDANGRLVTLNCEALNTSHVINSTTDRVTANDCRITSVKGAVSVSGGTYRAAQEIVDSMTATTLSGTIASIDNLNVGGSLSCNRVYYGTRKLSITNVRNIFYNRRPLDKYQLILNDSLPKSTNVWDMSVTNGSPRDFGFTENLEPMPGMICIQGLNKYKSFAGYSPTNVKVSHSGNTFDIPMPEYSFSAVLLWPTGYIDTDNNRLLLTHFSQADLGNDIYYMTGGEKWIIYRTMTIDGEAATFGNPYMLPPYSCIRFIANIRSDGNIVMSVLEIA